MDPIHGPSPSTPPSTKKRRKSLKGRVKGFFEKFFTKGFFFKVFFSPAVFARTTIRAITLLRPGRKIEKRAGAIRLLSPAGDRKSGKKRQKDKAMIKQKKRKEATRREPFQRPLRFFFLRKLQPLGVQPFGPILKPTMKLTASSFHQRPPLSKFGGIFTGRPQQGVPPPRWLLGPSPVIKRAGGVVPRAIAEKRPRRAPGARV